MCLLLVLTYPFARCIFGFSLAIEWVSPWLLRTRVPDINRFITVLNTSVVKSLLVLRLRAIWHKEFIGERARNICQWIHYIDLFWISVTLIVYIMTAGMFCWIWLLIDWDDWWSTLVEVLVCLKYISILHPPTDHIFQTAMSLMIVYVYVQSVFGLLAPLHSCWLKPTHLLNIQTRLDSAFGYVFYHISFFWLAYLFS